jgi:glycosyltransferase involved in cell wall biosynthesis
MRVTFVTNYYPPEVGAPQTRIAALVQGLADRGASVTVHTCAPHYPDGRVRPPYRNRPFQVEQRGPARVVRSLVYPAANEGVARRVAGQVSSAASAVATAPLTGAADVVIAESPPLFTAAAAVAYARLKRAPLVINVADRWPLSAVELGAIRQRSAIRAATWLEHRCYRSAAAIVTVGEGMAAALAGLDSARGRVHAIPPGVDLDAFRPSPRPRGGPLRLLYAGTLGASQRLETVLEAARLAGPEVLQVTLVGDGAEAARLREVVRAGAIENVRIADSVDHEAVPALYSAADAAVVALRGLPVFEEAVPTKLLEAMAAGRAVLLSGRGEAARLVRRLGCGVVVEPEQPGPLAAAVEELAGDADRLDALGSAGRRAAEREFGRERFVERWWEVVRAVTDRRPV